MNTGIPLTLNFDLRAPLPLDQRLSVNTTAELNSITQPYSGMPVYSADTQKMYFLKNIVNGQKSWVEFPASDELVKNYGNETINGIKTFSSRPNVNGSGFLVQGDITLGDVIGVPNFPTNAVYNDNLLMSCAPSGYLTGDGYSGNYDGGYFFGRTKLTQNTTRILESTIGDNFIPVTGTSVLNGSPFSGAWRWLSASSDAKYITASRDSNYLYSSNDFGKTWYPTAKNIGNRNWRGTAMSADGKYQTAVSTNLNFNGVVAVSKDYGTSWVTKFQNTNDWVAPAISSDGKYQTVIYSNGNLGPVYIFRSSDYGESFSQVGPIANSVALTTLRFISMSSDGKYQTIVATKYILASSDYGVTWRQAYVAPTSVPFFSVSMTTNGRFQIVSTSGGNSFNGQVYISNDYGYTWNMVKDFGRNIGLTSISNSDHGRLILMSMKNGFILTSTDYGNNWKVKTTKLNNTTTLTSAISDTITNIINVTSSAGMSIVNSTDGSNFLLIDDEILYITGISGNTLTVVRGYAGTTASTHANAATVILSNDWRRTAISNDGKCLLACDNNYNDPATNTKGGYIYISMTDEKVDGNFYADNLVYNVGNQNISGVKNFISRPQFNGSNLATTADVAAGVITDYVKLTTDQTIAGLKTFSNGIISTVGVTGTNLVYNAGDQTISGIKTFDSRPTVNGTGVLLSGSTPFVINFGHTRNSTTSAGIQSYYFGPQGDLDSVSLSNNDKRRVQIMQNCFLRRVAWSTIAKTNPPTPSNAITGYFKNFGNNPLSRDDVAGVQVTPAINIPASNIVYNTSTGDLNIPIASGDYVSFYYQTNFNAGSSNLASGLGVNVYAYFYV